MNEFSPPGQGRDILTVSGLNRLSRQILETQLPLIWVEGELSNLARPSSGHWYFTLKDDAAQVRCAMFKNRNQAVRFGPMQGQHVLLRARVSLYEGRGDYQLIAEHMEEAGFGKLQREFEALKARLADEGLFDPERKQVLPILPGHIAVITSPTGAAIRDVLSVLKRRFAACKVTVIPCPVQGREAAPGIMRALQLAEQAGLFDAVILTRGGGSMEDLWAFNDEALTRAIAACTLPVISAVGHEIDFTLADFAADVRAPTPSAAAELMVPDAGEWRQRLIQSEQRLSRVMRQRLVQTSAQFTHLSRRLRHPGQALQAQAQRLDQLEMRLGRAINGRLEREQTRFKQLQLLLGRQHPARQLSEMREKINHTFYALETGMNEHLAQLRQRLATGARLLQTVSPLSTLDRGYAIVSNETGELVRTVKQVKPGDKISARLGRGRLLCTVTSTGQE